MNQVYLVDLTVDMTDEQLFETMARMYEICAKGPRGFTVTINGYNDDPRELNEIPEVIEFYKRLIKLGFLSLLEGSTRTEMASQPGLPGIGALEIWAAVNLQCINDQTIIEKTDFLNFQKCYLASHEVYLNHIYKTPIINEGLNRVKK